ncbi:MAG TPA: hypothetical protein VGN16_14930, partial [Acidobacteriaceae bacterium]
MADIKRSTPGVFVNELDPFAPSIVGVPTAVPAFVGYTSSASLNGVDTTLKPLRISSMAEYRAIFGGAPTEDGNGQPVQTFQLMSAVAGADYDFVDSGGHKYTIQRTGAKARDGLLYYSMELFFQNGGTNCYVVSIGGYPPAGMASMSDLKAGLDALADQVGPTMLVIPDATLFAPASVANASKPGTPLLELAQRMLQQCADKQDRIALLDAWHMFPLAFETSSDTLNTDLAAVSDQFRADVGSENLKYGAAYAPYLNTSVVAPENLSYVHFDPASLSKLLIEEAKAIYTPANNPRLQPLLATIAAAGDRLPPPSSAAAATINSQLKAQIPLLKQIYSMAASMLGLLPPSPAMAGVMTHSDETRGVWNAPANLAVKSSVPSVKLNADQQEGFNVPLDGKAINLLREFVGQGTLVWGARTLDGNSLDFRYVQVRRTLIYVEQSIQAGLNSLAFAANDGPTWTAATAMVSNFLQ